MLSNSHLFRYSDCICNKQQYRYGRTEQHYAGWRCVFITKPYNPAILLAKIAALLKKAYRSPAKQKFMREATLHLESSMIEYKGQKELTKNELKILYYLLRTPEKIRSEMILWIFLGQSALC